MLGQYCFSTSSNINNTICCKIEITQKVHFQIEQIQVVKNALRIFEELILCVEDISRSCILFRNQNFKY